MKMRESKFGAPVGIYTGQFLGIKPMKPGTAPRTGKDGLPMELGVEWQFEITGDPKNNGKFVGQLVGRITSPTPTTKNSCGKLLSGLVGRTVAPDEDVEPGDYVGFSYQIVIGPGVEDPTKTTVVQIDRVAGGKPPAATAAVPGYESRPVASPPASTTAAPKPPLPPPPAPRRAPKPPVAPPTAAVEPRYWIDDGVRPRELMTATQVRDAHKTSPEEVGAWQWMPEDQSADWAPVGGSFLSDPQQMTPF